jgi:nudix-type nucleoside diphosphatase (YffH/AdpP family)
MTAIEAIDVEYEGWATLSIASLRLPDGRIIRREIEDHGAAVAVLAYDPQRRTALLVRQFRAPPFVALGQAHTLEVIAGVVEDADPAETARREALEEAGLQLCALERVAEAWTMPGISTERMTLYLAAYEPADRVADGGGVAAEGEDIVVVELALDSLAALMDEGALVDMKTLTLTQALRLRRPDLFS